MFAGKLDQRITIQRATVSTSDSGDTVTTWNAIALRRAASIRPVPVILGAERLGDQQLVARQHNEFRMRYSLDIADLNAKDRIIYPALALDSPDIAGSKIYDIVEVNEVGRREGFSVIAILHEDQP